MMPFTTEMAEKGSAKDTREIHWLIMRAQGLRMDSWTVPESLAPRWTNLMLIIGIVESTKKSVLLSASAESGFVILTMLSD